MRKREKVSGVHAPGPRATPWAALLVASLLCLVFLLGLGLWRIVALLAG
jgi:hypothetical protein